MTSALVPYIWVNLEALLLRVSQDGSGSCSAVLHLYVYCMEIQNSVVTPLSSVFGLVAT